MKYKSRNAFTRCVFLTTGRRNLTADLTAGSTRAGTRGCVASTEFSHERSHVHGGQRSTEWICLGAFTSDADRRRKWPRRRGDAAREERRIFHVGKRDGIFRAESHVRAEKLVDTIYACMFITSQHRLFPLRLDSISEKEGRMHRSILLRL